MQYHLHQLKQTVHHGFVTCRAEQCRQRQQHTGIAHLALLSTSELLIMAVLHSTPSLLSKST